LILRLNPVARALSLLLMPMILMVISRSPVVAQVNPETTDKELIQKLLFRIDQLETSQNQMRDKLEKLAAPAPETALPAAVPAAAPSSAATALVPAEAAATETAPTADDQNAPEPEAHVLGPIQFRGFTDLNYGRPPFDTLPTTGLLGSTNSFNIGDFDLFVHSRLSEHWSFLAEMLVTADTTNEFSIEMDRLLLSFKPNEYLQIGFGKFNTALGYYTNAFQRARYFQFATSRPMMYGDEDDGGILPVHSIGVTATGKIPSGVVGLHWVAEVANGRNVNIGQEAEQNFVDNGNGKAFNLAVYARPEGWHGFQTGFSMYRDVLHLVNFPPAIGETIFTGHIVYNAEKFEWLNEFSYIRHSLIGKSALFNSNTSYSEISYLYGKIRPYFRYEYQNVPDVDPVYGLDSAFGSITGGRRNGPSFGVSRHVTSYGVMKFQYGRLSQSATHTANDFQAQLAVAF